MAITVAATVETVAHERLAALVPGRVGEWVAGPVTGNRVTTPMPASHVVVSYTRGDARIDLDITDTAGHLKLIEGLQTMAGSGLNQRMANGYLKGTTIGGFPAIESWNHESRAGEINVLVENRFIVHASGTKVASITPLIQVVGAIDLAALAALR